MTREAILRAALDDLIAHGLDADLDGICTRAGCTRRFFQRYFQTREDLIVALTRVVVGAMVESLLAGAREANDVTAILAGFTRVLASRQWPFVPRIGVGFLRLLDAMDRWPALRLHFNQPISTALAALTRTATAAQQAGRIRADIGPRELATLLLLNALGAIFLHGAGVALHAQRQRALLRALVSH